jgi:DNA-binding transcriptional MerR regulator
MQKSADAYRTISEVADALKLPQHVLRFWETRFPQIKPMKRGGGRRFYRPEDIELLRAIKTLLYGDGYTIKGVQRILKEQGPRAVAALAQAGFASSGAPLGQETIADVNQQAEDPDPPRDAEPRLPASAAPVRRVLPASEPRTPVDRLESARPHDIPLEPLADRLHMVLFELSECERLLAAVR